MPLLRSHVVFVACACLIGSASLARAQFFPALKSPFYAGHSLVGVVSTDFDRDGKPDLAVISQTDNSVILLHGDGKGGFSPFPWGPSGNGVFAVGMYPSAIATADFNNDQIPDLAVANIGGNNVTILLSNPSGGYTRGPSQVTGNGPAAIVTADFDGDGHFDFATANADDGTVTIWFGDGNGGFSHHITLGAGKYPVALVAADLNADSTPDIAVANAGDGSISVFTDPGSSIQLPVSILTSGVIPTPGAVTQSLGAITAANFTGHAPNANGLPYLDLAVTYYDDSSFQGNLLLFVAGVNGTYTSAPTSPYFTQSPGLQPLAIGAAVFGSLPGIFPDSPPGVAIADYLSGSVTVFAGDGLGHLTPLNGSPYPVGQQPRALAIGDFNGDGLPDIATVSQKDGTVSILLNGFATTLTAVSAAAGNISSVAPGSLATIYGPGLAYPPDLSKTTVSLTDASGVVLPLSPAAILFSSTTQINLQVPPQAAMGSGVFTVTSAQGVPQNAAVTIAAAAPALFSANSSGSGPAAGYLVNQLTANGTPKIFNCVGSPAWPCAAANTASFDVSSGNTLLVLYGTGIPAATQSLNLTATVNGASVSATATSAEAPGVELVTLNLPATLAHSGTVYVQVAVGASMSNQVTIDIQ